MKHHKTCVFFPTIIVMLLLNINNSHGQNPNMYSNIDSSNIHSTYLSIGIAAVPLCHSSNNYISANSGLYCAVKFGKGSAPEISTGLYYDFKKYTCTDSYIPPNSTSTSQIFKYHYLYIPVLINIYFRESYLSVGIMNRIPIGYPSSDKVYALNDIPNPSWGLQIGYGGILPFKASNFILHLNPYLVIMGGEKNDYSMNSIMLQEHCQQAYL